MRKMTKREVNEWVARFAGFKFDNRPHGLFGDLKDGIYHRIDYPGGGFEIGATLPNFTDSTDSLLRWAFPEVHRLGMHIAIYMHRFGGQVIVHSDNAKKPSGARSFGSMSEAPLACCIAFIQSVDGEEVEVVG